MSTKANKKLNEVEKIVEEYSALTTVAQWTSYEKKILAEKEKIQKKLFSLNGKKDIVSEIRKRKLQERLRVLDAAINIMAPMKHQRIVEAGGAQEYWSKDGM